ACHGRLLFGFAGAAGNGGFPWRTTTPALTTSARPRSQPANARSTANCPRPVSSTMAVGSARGKIGGGVIGIEVARGLVRCQSEGRGIAVNHDITERHQPLRRRLVCCRPKSLL